MAERFKQQKDFVSQQDLFQSVTVSDYLFTKCLLFAKVNLPDDEFRLYQRLFDIIQQQIHAPDILNLPSFARPKIARKHQKAE